MVYFGKSVGQVGFGGAGYDEVGVGLRLKGDEGAEGRVGYITCGSQASG